MNIYGQVGWRAAAAVGPQPSTPLTTGLYAVYKAENNANDSLGTYNGTAIGGLTYAAGKSGNAFNFNGTNAYVDLGNNIFNSFTSDFSVSMWFNVNTVSGNQTLFSTLSYNSGNGIGNGWFITLRSNALVFEIYTNSGSSSALSSGNIINTSTWYNVIITRKGATGSKVYINGSLISSNSSTLDVTYNTSSLQIPCSIGAWKYASVSVGNYTNGKIDELNIWNKELTAADVTALYNGGTGKFYPTF